MKTTRNIVIDVEINQRLKKEPSASELINKLLRDYYDLEKFKGLAKEERKQLIGIMEDIEKKNNILREYGFNKF